MFKITTLNFKKEEIEKYIELNNLYHSVYLLENGKEVYIGETSDFFGRTNSHKYSTYNKKYKFTKIHVITGDKSHETVAKLYEKLLIKLMRIDGKFQVVNKKPGQKITEFKNKNELELEFDKLWFKLEEKKLVKTKEFKSIINSNLYKYSVFNELNKEQKKALTSIINVLHTEETKGVNESHEERSVLINGNPGTGKTLVAMNLFNYIKKDELLKNKKVALIYPNTNMRSEVEFIFKYTKDFNKKDVKSPIDITHEKYDIAIVDEAQKLRKNKNLNFYSKYFKEANKRLGLDNDKDELDWILKNSKLQIFFYDPCQIVSPSEISYESFEKRVYNKLKGIRPITLKKQMRVQGGEKYLKYINNILLEKNPKKIVFNNYEFKLVSSFKELKEIKDKKEKQYGLCRFASGYGYPWEDEIKIDKEKAKWNSKMKGWIRSIEGENEVGSIYTLSGTDLNYSFIVFSEEIYYDKKEKTIKINRKNFYDNKVKKGVADDELKTYILNTYRVLLTRGIKGTYIYICDKNLREYFNKYIDYND